MVTHIDGHKMDLGVTVLAGLGGGHVDDLARAVLDHDVTATAGPVSLAPSIDHDLA